MLHLQKLAYGMGVVRARRQFHGLRINSHDEKRLLEAVWLGWPAGLRLWKPSLPQAPGLSGCGPAATSQSHVKAGDSTALPRTQG